MKLLRLKPVFLFAVLVCASWACQKNNSSEIGEEVTPPVKETVQTSVQGRVLDEHAQPLSGATVMCGSKDTTTDINGNFLLENVTVNQDAAVVTVSKTQYISGFRTLVVNPNSLHYVQLMLHERNAAATFSTTAGGTVSLSEGQLTIPPNSVLLENNTPYNGIADVNFRYITPESDRFPNLMAGDLRGINRAKTQMGLQSYSMMVFELTGQNGEKLHLNKAITAKINIPGSLQTSAPAQIPLWYFDSATGYWTEDGIASKEGDAYVATVKSTGFWHYAIPYALVGLQIKVVDQHNAPVPNMQVTILRKLDFIPVFSYTDVAGRYTGKVPANSQLILTFTDPCKDLFFHPEIGPFAVASVINNMVVTLPASNTLAVDGTASNCDNKPVAKGIVSITVDGLQYATNIEKGHFTMNILRCNSTSANVTFTAKDAATNITTVTTINANNGSVTPSLVVCTP